MVPSFVIRATQSGFSRDVPAKQIAFGHHAIAVTFMCHATCDPAQAEEKPACCETPQARWLRRRATKLIARE
jgi:hypothetical protein